MHFQNDCVAVTREPCGVCGYGQSRNPDDAPGGENYRPASTTSGRNSKLLQKAVDLAFTAGVQGMNPITRFKVANQKTIANSGRAQKGDAIIRQLC